MTRGLISVFSMLMFASLAFAHCQVPCGIYGDQLRFEQMLEDQKTDYLEELIEMAYSISLTKAHQKFEKFLDFEEFLSKITEFSKDLSLFRYVYKPGDVLANHAQEHMRRKMLEEEISRTLNRKINEKEEEEADTEIEPCQRRAAVHNLVGVINVV